MINIQFNIRNPFSDRWDCVYGNSGKTPFKNKFWELQIDKTSDVIGVDIRFTTRQDHAGLFINFALFGYDIIFNLYDDRHWDYDKKCWRVYGKENI